jgi:ribosomal protein L19
MKTNNTPSNLLKKYTHLFSTGTHSGTKNKVLKFSYFLVSKKTHFIGLEGVLVRNSKKRFSINQTYTITTSLKKQWVQFTIPIHSNAVLVL